MDKFQKHFANAFILSIALIVGFIILELLFRVVFVKDWASIAGATYPDLRPTPYTMFSGNPNDENETQVPGESTNANGYRGPVATVDKPQGEYRIFFLGGSSTFLGNPSIPKIVESILHEANRKNVKVYNYGLPSAKSGDELARLVYEISDLKPDLVIMYNGGNDIIESYHLDPRPGYPYNYLVYDSNPLFKKPGTYPTFALLFYGSAIFRKLFHSSFERRLVGMDDLRESVGYLSKEWQKAIALAYVQNLVRAERVAKGSKAKFLAFFQPLSIFQKDSPRNLSCAIDVEVGSPTDPKGIHTQGNAIREEIQGRFRSYPSFHDISDIYSDKNSSEVFKDCIHTKQEFKPTVARGIADVVLDL